MLYILERSIGITIEINKNLKESDSDKFRRLILHTMEKKNNRPLTLRQIQAEVFKDFSESNERRSFWESSPYILEKMVQENLLEVSESLENERHHKIYRIRRRGV